MELIELKDTLGYRVRRVILNEVYKKVCFQKRQKTNWKAGQRVGRRSKRLDEMLQDKKVLTLKGGKDG